MPTTEKFDIYQHVTDQIVTAIENGVAPWRKPWKSILDDSTHRNFSTKKAYRGVNPILLDIVAATQGYELPFWLTMKQVSKIKGAKVREDQFVKNGGPGSTLVTFWKINKYETRDEKTGEKKEKSIPMLRFYSVWNVAQCEGIDLSKVIKADDENHAEHPKAASVYASMPNHPALSHGGDRAFYRPDTDAVRLPAKKAFTNLDEYYSTQFHELAHSTGHSTRLNREFGQRFGDEPYANEELVAEMTSAMVCGTVNIDCLDNSAAYVGGWLNRLKNDRKLIVRAAGQAQKAADCILGITYEDKDKAEKATVTA